MIKVLDIRFMYYFDANVDVLNSIHTFDSRALKFEKTKFVIAVSLDNFLYSQKLLFFGEVSLLDLVISGRSV